MGNAIRPAKKNVSISKFFKYEMQLNDNDLL